MDPISFIKEYATPVLAVLGSGLSIFQIFRAYRAKCRAQAEQISAWWVRVDKQISDTCIDQTNENDNSSMNDDPNKKVFENPPMLDEDQYYVGIVLLNRSQTPIRNMVVYGQAYKMDNGKRFHQNGETKAVNTLLKQPILVPGEYISFAVGNYEKSTPRPWTYPEELDATRKTMGKVRPIINDNKWDVTQYTFEDAAGRNWIRTKNGKLYRYLLIFRIWNFLKTYRKYSNQALCGDMEKSVY